MTNTAGTKGKGTPAAPKAPARNEVLVGQTFRKIQLTTGWRPFAVVAVDTERDTASGWLFLDPLADSGDALLRSHGIQAEARRQPCYITVSTDLVR